TGLGKPMVPRVQLRTAMTHVAVCTVVAPQRGTASSRIVTANMAVSAEQSMVAMATGRGVATATGGGTGMHIFRADVVVSQWIIGAHPVKHSGRSRRGSHEGDQTRGNGEAKHGQVP